MVKEKIAVVTDSTCDLPKVLAEKMGITVIPLHVVIGHETFRDGVDIKAEEFYRLLALAKKLPTTTQPTPYEFRQAYSRLLEDYDRVLSLHISSKLSGTIQAANHAAAEFGDRVITWDTKSVTLGVGLQAHAAAEALIAGADLSDVLELLGKMRDTMTLLFTLDTLEYLRKGGRIGAAASLLGSVLNIKPIIKCEDGYYHAFGKARSQKRALKMIIKRLVELGEVQPVKRFAIGHGMARASGEYLQRELTKAFKIQTEVFTQVGPVMAAHTGPGAIGVAISYY